MFRAVHSDRSGRIVVASDYGAARSDGRSVTAIAGAIALPAGTEIVSLTDRQALGLDHAGRPLPLGEGRWAVGAVLPFGYLRTALPAYRESARAVDLRPRAYAAVGAEEGGEIVVCGLPFAAEATAPDARTDPDLDARITSGIRERPANRLVRQLVRCAREFKCRAAANAFAARYDCALPIAAPPNERPAAVIALHDDTDAFPTEPAAFHPSADEIAELAVAHLDGGGASVAFGQACEGEPLLDSRTVEETIARIRKRTGHGGVHLETNGSAPETIGRLQAAGLDAITFRMLSTRPDTYEALHRPSGFRANDVRASLADSVARGLATSLALPVLPGLTDRPSEIDALVALGGELREGTLELRNAGADPERALALVRSSESPVGVDALLARLREELAHLRLVMGTRPLART